MADTFLHGVEVIEVDSGARPIRTERTNTVGVLGLAFEGPVNEPVEIRSRVEAEQTFGAGGTLPAALAGVQSQILPRIVAVNALDPATHKTSITDEAATFAAGQITVKNPLIVTGTVVLKNMKKDKTFALDDDYTVDRVSGVISRVATGTIKATEKVKVAYDYFVVGKVTANHLAAAAAKFAEAESALGLRPKILIAPGHTDTAAVTTGLLPVAEQLRAVIVADGPSTTDAAAITYRNLFGSRRVYLVDPQVKIASGESTVDAPASGYAAGVIVRSDAERGFWWSPSNREMAGVSGTARRSSNF